MALTTVMRDGVALHTRVDGPTGMPTLVYLNSLGTDLRLWDAVVAALPGCRHVRFDARGHGLSDCPAGPYTLDDLTHDAAAVIDAVIDGTGGGPAVIVGCSIGGVIAQDLAAKRPDLVSALVLSNTATRIGTAESWRERITAVETGGVAGLADAVLARWFAPVSLSSPAVAPWRRMLMTTPDAGYAATCAVLAEADLTEAAASISVPTLVVAGGADQATPPDLVAGLADLIPGARLATIEEAGHLPAAETPAAFIDLLSRFLTDLAGPDDHAAGMAVRRSVLGEAHVDRATAGITEFDADFQDFITRTAWARVWSRPGLDRPTRSLITLAILAALGREAEVAMHIRATRNTGATQAQVREMLLHVALYAGLPAANAAIGIAKKIYAEEGEHFDA